MCAWDGWVRERSTLFGDGRLDQGADKMDDDIEVEKPRCLFKCSSSGLGLPGSTSMVFARNSQFKVFFATTLHLRLHFKYSKLLTDVRLRRPREESLGGWSVGELEGWNLRGGEWEKVGGRRQKQESGVPSVPFRVV